MPKVRAILWGCLAGTALAVLLKAGYILAGPNLYAVIPGEVYRCAQPSEAGLERLIRRLNIRMVVNLRGSCAPDPWYLAEVRACNRLNVSHEDLSMSAGRLRDGFRDLVRRLYDQEAVARRRRRFREQLLRARATHGRRVRTP